MLRGIALSRSTLPIINRLADHGIDSSLAIGGTIGSQIRAGGFDLIELSLPESDAKTGETGDGWSPYHFLSRHNADLELLLDHVEAYRKAISDGCPAIVVTDINPVAALAAKTLQVPQVTISQSLFLPFRKLNSSRWRMPSALPAINNVLSYYGVDLVDCAECLDVGDTTFVPSFPEFDPMQNPPPTLHYAGPILGNQLIPLRLSADRFSSAKPRIFLYPGRPHDAAGPSGQALLNVGLKALSAVDATVTVATGGYDFNLPHHSGTQVEVVSWRVISPDYRPDLIIHHGGHGACLTAISAGIPSVIVPTHAEREYNATNLAALGCGEFVGMDQIDVPTVRRAIDNVIDNPDYGFKCAQWSETIAARKYEGPGLVARIMMQIVDPGRYPAGS